MRKDINTETLFKGGDIKINKTAMARQYNCCWRTIDRKINPDKYKKDKKKRIYTSKLDNFKAIIDSKIENDNIPATGIYFLLKNKYNYNGKYGIINRYVSSKKKQIIKDLTIRFETIKGYQSQVDWKESLKLHDIYKNEYIVNIFLIVLGNSRYKYIELTFDRVQSTLFKCLNNAFKYFGGTTSEILFDNMKTIVNHAKSLNSGVILNEKAEQYSKDAGFKIITCKIFKPRTKGKVETLAKIMNRLKAFDYEFKDYEDLKKVVKDLNYSLNYEEISQATNQKPIDLYTIEKEYLIPINIKLLETYIVPEKKYKVSKESMINYKGIKYSVPIQYIDKELTVLDEEKSIHIYYNSDLIYSYNKNKKYRYNYKEDDYINILKESAFDKKTSDEIRDFISKNLNSMDGINVERK